MQVKQRDILQNYISELLKDIEITNDLDDRSLNNKQLELATPLMLETTLSADIIPSHRDILKRNPFQCLVFSVGGVDLAAPLTCLGRVQVIKNLTPIIAQSKMICGVMSSFGEQLRVVDTLRLIMPERYNTGVAQHYSHVIVVRSGSAGTPWGLAVNAIADSICVEPEAVNWQKSSGKNPWLMGIVLERMCALLDIPELDNLLAQHLVATAK